MIRLTKGAKPAVLISEAAAWTKELLDIVKRGGDPSATQRGRYRHAEIKQALIVETNAKCVYCESKILHVVHGDIEHIIPKVLHPELSFEWSNLTLACDICNTNKGATDGLLDPYAEDPEAHFLFLGPMLTVRPDKEGAKLTDRVLELNRIKLFERRREKIANLVRQLEELCKTRDAALRTLLRKALVEDETRDEREYAACTRAFVKVIEAEGHIEFPLSAD
jgi:uncharacterized protein (TIGR02646 family)